MRTTIFFFVGVLMAIAYPTAAQTLPSNPEDAFAVKLFDALREAPGNIVFSPSSVHTALAMAALGARGETAKQLFSALYGTDSPPAADKALPATAPGKSSVSIANALWMQHGIKLDSTYENAVKSRFDSELSQVNFEGDPDGSRSEINQWVAGKTNGKIPNLFTPGSITAADRLILVNAIYFKAAWRDKFQVAATRDEPFKIGGKDVDVPTMHLTHAFDYFEHDGVQVISLPYEGEDDLAMIILLPRSADGLPDLEKSLTAGQIAEWESQLASTRVALSMPKWKSSSTFQMIPPLQALGIRNAFTDAADLTGISATPLKINGVFHQAVIEVDESGTEAAAATGLRMASALAVRRAPPVPMVIDHPFLYVIQKRNTNNASGSILFLGRVADPRH